jgi:transcriptional regulator with XRE-family HTH domain
MNKELYNKRWKSFREVLKIERKHHKISQKRLALMLGIEQSYISKTEIGDRRLDVIELIEYCDAMGLTLTEFVFRMEGRLLADGLMSPARKEQYSRWLAIYREYNKNPPDPYRNRGAY